MLRSKEGLEAGLKQSQEQSRQLEVQIKALQCSMLEQAQHAQQSEAQMRSKFESEVLRVQGMHSAEVIVLKEQQAAAVEELQEAMQQQQHQAQQVYADLLARHTVLERRFNAR